MTAIEETGGLAVATARSLLREEGASIVAGFMAAGSMAAGSIDRWRYGTWCGKILAYDCMRVTKVLNFWCGYCQLLSTSASYAR